MPATRTPTPTAAAVPPLPDIAVIATIATGKQPSGLAVDPGQNRVYVANFLDDSVSVIDGNTQRIVSTISDAAGDGPIGLTLDAAGRLFIANSRRDTIAVAVEHKLNAIVKAGQRPKGVTGLDGKIYVANSAEKTVSILAWEPAALWKMQLPIWRSASAITVGNEPSWIAADVNRARIYATNRGSNTVSVVDGNQRVVIATVPVGGEPYGIAVNPHTNRIYTANRQGKSVSVIDGSTFQVIQTIPLQGPAYTVSVNPKSGHLFVVTADSQRVWVIQEETRQVIGSVPIGRGATEGMVLNPATDRVYIANGLDNTVTVIQDRSVLREMKVGNLVVRANEFTPQTDGRTRAVGNVQIGDYVGLAVDTAAVLDPAKATIGGSGQMFFRTAGLPIPLLKGDFAVDAVKGTVTLSKGNYLLSKVGAFTLRSDGLALNVNAVEGTVSGQGGIALALPGNPLALDVAFQVTSKGEVRGEIRKPFKVALAGCTLDVGTALLDGETLRISTATLNLPKGLGGSGVVKDVRLSTKAPYVTIGGGRTAFALPAIAVGGEKGFRLVALQATLELEGDGYIFKGKGGFELPYTRAEGGNPQVKGGYARIDVDFQLSAGKLRQVGLRFRGDGVRIPIDASGFSLREVSGQLTMEPGTTIVKVEVELVMEPKVQNVYPLSGRVGMTFDTRGEVRIAGTLTALERIQVGSAQVVLSVPKRMASLKGWTRFGILEGNLNVTVWKDQQGRIHFTGRAVMTVQLNKGAIYHDCWFGGRVCLDIPPRSMSLGQVGTEFGQFCSNRECTATAWGFKGWVTAFKKRAGFYVDSQGSASITNIDRYTLYPQRAALLSSGVAWAASDTDLLPPVAVPATAPSVLFALAWETGDPRLSLVQPDGREITPETIDPNIEYVSSPNQAFYTIVAPASGQWQARVSNVTGQENYLFSALGANAPPTVTVESPAKQEERGDPDCTIRWKATDPDDQVVVSLYYDTDNTGSDGLLIATGLPGEQTQYVWDTSAVPTGVYYVYARAEDLRNPPVTAYSAGTVKVVNTTPPAVPTGIVITPSVESLFVTWTPNQEADLGGYRVYYGPTPGAFTDVLDVGASAGTVLAGLPAGTGQYVAVSAYDTSGNASAVSPAQNAIPVAATPPFVQAMVSVEGGPAGMAVDSEANLVFVAAQETDTVLVLDGAVNTIVSSLTGIDPQPYALALNSLTGRLYAGHPSATSLSVVDGLSAKRIGNIPVGSSPRGLAWLGNKIYVANSGDTSLTVIDGATEVVVGTVPVGREPSSVAVDPQTNRIYTANEQGQSISVIDGDTQQVMDTIVLGTAVQQIAVNPNTGHIFAVSPGEGSVAVIDSASRGLLIVLPVEKGAAATIALNSTTDRVYVASGDSNTVTVIQDGVTPLQPGPINTPVAPSTPAAGLSFAEIWLYFFGAVWVAAAFALVVVLAVLWRRSR